MAGRHELGDVVDAAVELAVPLAFSCASQCCEFGLESRDRVAATPVRSLATGRPRMASLWRFRQWRQILNVERRAGVLLGQVFGCSRTGWQVEEPRAVLALFVRGGAEILLHARPDLRPVLASHGARELNDHPPPRIIRRVAKCRVADPCQALQEIARRLAVVEVERERGDILNALFPAGCALSVHRRRPPRAIFLATDDVSCQTVGELLPRERARPRQLVQPRRELGQMNGRLGRSRFAWRLHSQAQANGSSRAGYVRPLRTLGSALLGRCMIVNSKALSDARTRIFGRGACGCLCPYDNRRLAELVSRLAVLLGL